MDSQHTQPKPNDDPRLSADPVDAHSPLAVHLATSEKRIWQRIRFQKVLLFILSLFLFILAINLMKTGARSLVPLIRDTFRVTNPWNSLGFGWLFAYLIMSGSPVAASALAFFDAGALGKLSTFTMITGSRLGASFIVLFLGFIYVLRGRNRSTSLSMGLLSLTVTGTTYFVGMFVGLALLYSDAFGNIRPSTGATLESAMDLLYGPIISFLMTHLPRWTLFPIGLGIILLSFNLFDRCLPEMSLKESQVGQVSRLVYKPWVMFLLGAGITTLSMSVSLSLSILLPLSARGYIRRENVIPYIMGANITTFIDTLLAAVLLGNPQAFTIVLAEMVSIAIVSIVLLLTIYGWYSRSMLRAVSWVAETNLHLAMFMITIFVIPLALLLV